MLNPRQHFPFPSFGLHLRDIKDEQEERLSWLHGEKKKKNDISYNDGAKIPQSAKDTCAQVISKVPQMAIQFMDK